MVQKISAALASTKSIEISSSVRKEKIAETPAYIKPSADYFKILAAYAYTGAGANKLFKLFKNVCEWPLLLNQKGLITLDSRKIEALEGSKGFLKTASSAGSLTKIPYTIQSFKEAAKKFGKLKQQNLLETDSVKKKEMRVKINDAREDFLKKGVDVVTDSSRIMQLLISCKVLKFGAQGVKAFSALSDGSYAGFNAIEIKQNFKAMLKSSKSEKASLGRNKIDFNEAKKIAFLNIVKSVASFASSFFAVLGLAIGVPLLSVTSLLVLSTVNVIFSVWGHFYKNTTHKALEKAEAEKLFGMQSA